MAKLQVTGIAILVTLTVSPFATVTTSVFLIDGQDVRRSIAEVHPPCSPSLLPHPTPLPPFLPSLDGELEGPMMVGEVMSTEMRQDETQLLFVRSMC